jgi:folylpolyglutamate synthase/dihydropteroate synthase
MTYRDAIDWLFSTQMFGIKLGLDGPRHLLKESLAYPSNKTKVIHVAGTNGKGSTCAMIDSVARAGGMRTGLFTSPHLIDYRERIKVSGVEILEDDCAELLTDLRAICERMETHPTFFEITLALAMRYCEPAHLCELRSSQPLAGVGYQLPLGGVTSTRVPECWSRGIAGQVCGCQYFSGYAIRG